MSEFEPPPQRPREERFNTTRWSVILQAADSNSPDFSPAMEALCRAYWMPLYSFLRKSGRSPADAGDLTQGFFAYWVEKRLHTRADPARGRFRTFLLAAFKRFLSSEAQHANRLKRAGGKPHIAIDAAVAEERFLSDSVADLSPEQMYDHEWAVLVFDTVLERVQQEYREAGLAERYEALCHGMMEPEDALPYAELGPRLGLSEDGVKSAARRLRQRFRELFREHLATQVESPADIDAEIQHLIAALRNPVP